MKRNDINIFIAITLVVTAIVLRIVNANLHLYNFVPMAALGLFSGSIIKDKKVLAFMVPLAGQMIADTYFQLFTNTPGFYPGQIFNYAALGAAAGLGLMMKEPKPVSILAYIFGASGLFFLISNLGVFFSGYYGYTFAGFNTTYFMAIPFFKNTLIGDMIGGVLMFGGFFLAQKLFTNKMNKAQL